MIFAGEIFSIFIIVIAAIETAIALCIILSYYRITNKNLNPIEHLHFYNIVIPMIGVMEFPILTKIGYYLLILICVIFSFYICMVPCSIFAKIYYLEFI